VKQEHPVVDVHIRGADLENTVQSVSIDADGPGREQQDEGLEWPVSFEKDLHDQRQKL
jgi:hypothetical protein